MSERVPQLLQAALLQPPCQPVHCSHLQKGERLQETASRNRRVSRATSPRTSRSPRTFVPQSGNVRQNPLGAPPGKCARSDCRAPLEQEDHLNPVPAGRSTSGGERFLEAIHPES